MNWEAIGALAEAIGVVAIIVSLVYVAVQIRQNTQLIARSVKATQLEAFERSIEAGDHIRELLFLHPDLGRLFLKGLDSYRGLDPSDKFRFGMLMRNTFSSLQSAHIRHLSVGQDVFDFDGPGNVIDSILVNPGGQEWLEKNKPDWRPEFQKFVDGRVAAIKQSAGEPPSKATDL